MNDQRHPEDLLQELLDGRLQGEERARVEAHLEGCERCRRLRDVQLAAQRLLRAAPTPAMTPELAQRLSDAVAGAATEAPPPAGAARRGHRTWLIAAVAATLLLAAGLAVLWRPSPRQALSDLVALHTEAAATITERDPAALERRLGEALPIRPRVLDLSMMGVQLAGGSAGTVGGTPAALMFYREPAGGRLLCAMWEGRLEDLPRPDEVRERAPFRFRVYRRGGLTVVAWQEGELVCALVGGGDPEAVIATAMAKAMLPARST